MKKISCIAIVICFGFNIVISQSLSRFPINPTSTWRINHVRNWIFDENTHEPDDDIYKYTVNGDTLISLKTYFKIYKTGTSYLDGPFSYQNIYTGALRDANNKFFFVKKYETVEVLLYDFNVKIDDTIRVPYGSDFEEKIVSSVDSLPDGRRIIHFNPKEPIIGCGDQYYIEGIGGSGGLIEGPACGHVYTYDYHLVCYVQNEELVYHDNNSRFNCEIADFQSFNKTIEPTGVWRINKQTDTDSIANFEKFNYSFCGDTVIETRHYYKLCKSGFQLLIGEDGQYTSGFNESVYVGALRDDNRKLYFKDKNKETEELLYNFGLQTGEINDGLIFQGDTVKMTDTILDNRKVLYLENNTWGKQIIMGIGTESGLLESPAENSCLICYMKGNAALYHINSGADCLLAFDKLEFNECEKIKIIPKNPTINDEIKLVTRTCYEVSSDNPVIPTLSGRTYLNDGYYIDMEIFYDYDKQKNSGPIKIVIPVFDTITLGTLNQGNYYINQYVHTIYHNNQIIDTAFSERNHILFFTVSQSNTGVENKIPNPKYKVYPVPSNNYITIENLNVNTHIHSIELFNIVGSKVATFMVEDQCKFMNKIDVSNLKKGVYLVTINSDNCSITNKIIIQ